MAASFNDMLNEHLHYGLLKEELKKKNYLWKTLEHDDEVAGDIIVPFQSGRASSVKAGTGPTAISDIAKSSFVRGSKSLSSIPRIWGSMIFNYEDILNHDGRVKQKSFLGTFLPQAVEDFTTYFSETVSHNALNSAWVDKCRVEGTAGGVIGVHRPERFEIAEKLILDPAGANLTAYVTAIDMNASTITVSATRGGAGLSVTGVAVGELIYKDGFQSTSLTSIRDSLLTVGAGGSANLYGVAKTTSPYTQAINIDGSAITATNFLDKLFDAYSTYKQRAKIGAAEVWMDLKNLGTVMKILEQDKGPYKAVDGTLKSNEYGFTEIVLFGPKASGIKLVGMQEMDSDIVIFADPKSMKFHSVKGIQKVKDPDNQQAYYVSRDTTNGYDFVCDLYYRGDLIISKPHRNAIIHSISYT